MTGLIADPCGVPRSRSCKVPSGSCSGAASHRLTYSSTHFWLAKPPGPLPDLRAQGIKLRDATSFGLPGWVRIAALAPESQQALSRALQP